MIDIIATKGIELIEKGGLNCIPVIMPEKRPASSWKPYQDRMIESEEFRRLHRGIIGESGVAVVCGKISGMLEVIDFDNKFGMADNVFKAFVSDPEVDAIIKKYNLPYESTYSGGYHLFYRCNKIEGNRKLASVTRDGVTECIIETRGEGGYLICDPTPKYRLLSGDLADISRITKEERQTLISAAIMFGEFKPETIDNIKPEHGEDIPQEFISNFLIESGFKYLRTKSINGNDADFYERPGKGKGQNSICYNYKTIFVYSSNVHPLMPAGKAFSKFQFYNLYKNNGDAAKSERELIEAGVFDPAKRAAEDDGCTFITYAVDQNGNRKYKHNNAEFIAYLHGKGYRRFDRAGDFIYVQVKDNVVKPVFVHEIIDEVQKDIADPEKRNYLIKNNQQFFNDKILIFLEKFNGLFHRDTHTTAFFYFADVYCQVTAGGIEIKQYSEMDGFIWDEQKRDFILNDKHDLLFKDEDNNDIISFFKKVTEYHKNPERYEALKSSIGYMLHRYKNSSLTKAVVLCDQGEIDAVDPDASQGGTGKSLIGMAISKMRNTAKKDARNFKFDGNFIWQDVDESTEIIWFDDASKRFSFERLYNPITGSLTIEKKNKNSFTIPFERAPKIMVCTNFTIPDSDESSKRRIHEIELAPVYNSRHRPIDDYGRMFFHEVDWTDQDWYNFYIFMMNCTREHIAEGLLDYAKINLNNRKKRQVIDEQYEEVFADIISGLQADLDGKIRISFSELYGTINEKITAPLRPKQQSLVSKMFTQYLEFERISYKAYKSGSRRGLIIQKEGRWDEEGQGKS